MKYPGAGIPAMERAAGLNDDNCYRFMGLYRNLIWTKEYMDFLSREEADSAAEGEADAAGAEAGKGFAAEAAIGRIVLPDAQRKGFSADGSGMRRIYQRIFLGKAL